MGSIPTRSRHFPALPVPERGSRLPEARDRPPAGAGKRGPRERPESGRGAQGTGRSAPLASRTCFRIVISRSAVLLFCVAAAAARPSRNASAQEPERPRAEEPGPAESGGGSPAAGGASREGGAGEPRQAEERQEAGVVPDSAARPRVSPLGALGRSLIVPGWGQVAAGKPGRGAFYFAAEAGSLFMVFKTQSKLDAARRASPADSALVDARKEQREDWIVLAAFFALLSGVDAWVSAHLQGFEGEVTPPADGAAGLELRYRIAVRGP
ncbi:MAG: hypothetical protein ACE5JR_02265 [Gemmatimonadota bacterium]